MKEIRVETNGAVRTVTIDRPEKRNALNPAMVTEITRLFEGVEPPDTERVTVIRGTGKTFTAGIDLSERISNGWPVVSPLVRMCEAIRMYPLPVLAAMHGDAIAGGAMMTMHCDLIIACEGARLAMTLAQIGIAPPYIVSARFVDRVGPALARTMLFLGDFIPVEKLAQHNAINECVSREDFEHVLQRYLDRLSQNAPLSLKAVKNHLMRIGDLTPATPIDEEERWTRVALDSADSKEGMSARLEHRAPRFQGK